MTKKVIDTKRLGRVLTQAKKNQWEGSIPSCLPPSLRMAVASTRYAIPSFWNKKPEEITGFLYSHPWVRKVFEETDEQRLAFAIRLARM
jgi:hypothetical protein